MEIISSKLLKQHQVRSKLAAVWDIRYIRHPGLALSFKDDDRVAGRVFEKVMSDWKS